MLLVAEFLVGDEGVDARDEGRLVDLDAGLVDAELAVENFQLGAAAEGEGNEIVDADGPHRGTVEILLDKERRALGALAAGPRNIEEAAEGELGGEEVILRLGEGGRLIAKADLGPQDVETGGAARVEERALARLLLAEEFHGLLLESRSCG